MPELPPIYCITLARTVDRWQREKAHLESVGIEAKPFYGVDGSQWDLRTPHNYEIDHPGSGFNISHKSSKLVALVLSHYTLWQILRWQEGEMFWILEDDALFDEDWRVRYDEAIASLPADWDLLFTGSCCTKDKPTIHQGGNIHEVKYPLCTHSYIVRQKALPVLLEKLSRIWAPLDCAMGFDAFPHMKVYTVLPTFVRQFDTLIPP